MAATDDTTGRMDEAAGDGAPISTSDTMSDTAGDTAGETLGDNAPESIIGGTDNAQVAQAGGAEPVGQVESMAGTVIAVRADGTRVELKTGDSIYQGDTLETAADGSIGVVLADQTTFSMASNGQMVIDQMVYDPGTNEGSISMSVVEGVFTFVSGQIAKTDPDAMSLNTPVATIGIRGTQVGIDVGEGKPMNVVLMEEADGFVGEVVVANDGGVQILNQAFQSTNVASSQTAPSESFIYDTQQLIQNFKGALGHLPSNNDNNANTYGVRPDDVRSERTEQEQTQTENLSEEQLAQEEAKTEGTQEEDGTPQEEQLAKEEGESQQAADELAEFETAAGPGEGEGEGQPQEETMAKEEGDGKQSGEPGAEELADFETAAGQAPGFGEDFTNIVDDGSGQQTENPIVTDEVTSPPPPPAVEATSPPPPPATTETVVTPIAPDISVGTTSGDEDSAIALNISVDPGTGTDLTITVAGVPAGASLSAGTDSGGGSWTLTPAQLAGLTITPPQDFNGTLNLSVEAASSAGTSGTVALVVAVAADDDAPEITQTAAADGLEDTAVALNLEASVPGSTETIAEITISGVPAGASLSAGTDNLDGTWTLTPAQLAGLTITPPVDSNADFTLTVEAVSTDGGTTQVDVPVNVAGVADDPTVSAANAEGEAGETTALNIQAALTDTDGSETLSVTISGVPTGAVLSLGTNNGDGSWTISGPDLADLADLTITPPADFAGDMNLTATAQSQEDDSGDIATQSANFTVSIEAPLEPPVVTVGTAEGLEDNAIALNIDVTDPNGTPGNTLEITLSSVPAGATLSAGTDNEDGTWTLTPEQLAGLTLTPPEDFSGDINIGVSAVVTDDDGDSAQTTDSFIVDVSGVADAPTLAAEAAAGELNNAIELDIAAALTDLDGSETLSITIAGVPAGAVLSAGTDNLDGTWTLSGEDLEGLTITPPNQFVGNIDLSITATASEDGTQAETTQSLDITVTATQFDDVITGTDGDDDIDAKSGDDFVSAGEGDDTVAGGQGDDILLGEGGDDTLSGGQGDDILFGGQGDDDLSGGQGDDILSGGAGDDTLDGGQGLDTAVFGGNYDDFTIVDNGDGTYTVTDTIGAGGSDILTDVETLSFDDGSVDIEDIGLPPEVSISPASGNEDAAIPLNVFVEIANPFADLQSITISGVPEGATLSLGTDNGDGSWTISSPEDFANLADLTLTSAPGDSTDLALGVSATVEDIDLATGEKAAFSSEPVSLPVTVDAVVEEATVTTADAAGAEDAAIEIDVAASLPEGSDDTITEVTIAGVPAGASLSAGTDNGDGTWTLTPAQLEGLTISPAAGDATDFTLQVTATSQDVDPETGAITTTSTAVPLDVTVAAVADEGTVAGGGAGAEDTAIALNLSTAIPGGDDDTVQSITISGLPEGATLSAGTDNNDGTFTVLAGDIAGLTVTPAAGSSADFDLQVAVTTSDTDPDTGETVTTTSDPVAVSVAVTGVADTPTLTVTDAAGSEDGAIALDIASALTDTDGSESLSITITGVPEGATLSTGTDNLDGTWTLSAAQLEGLSITPAANSSDDFNLTVTATSTEDDGDTAQTVASLNVAVTGVADTPTLTVTDAAGSEDGAIALDIASALTDTDGSESLSITIAGVPEGATLSAGTDNLDGTWTLTPDQLTNLSITPAANSNADFTLSVTATSQDVDPETGAITTTSTAVDLPVDVQGVADAPTLSASIGAGEIVAGDTGSITITNVGDASAGYHNSYGYYVMDENGNPTEGGIIWSDVHDSEGESFTLEGVDPASIGFFLIPNGDQMNNSVSDGMPVTFEQTANGEWHAVGPDGQQLKGAGDPVLFSDPALNENNFDYTQDGASPGNQNWEDLANGGDGDFNDVNMQVDTQAGAPGMVQYPLNIEASLTDTDGSESLSITVAGLPDGAALSAGTDNNDGTWTLSPDQLDGLTLTTPLNVDLEDFALTITATSTEDDGDTASTSATLGVTTPDTEAETPDLAVAAAAGDEDNAIALDIDAALTDTDGSESLSITIAGVPDGAALSAGTDNGDGSWTLTPAQLTGLTITPPAGDSTDFALNVTATSTESSTGDTAVTTANLNVVVDAVVGQATVTAADAAGAEDSAIALDIAAFLPDGSDDTITEVTIAGVPEGAVLSAGTDNNDGTWTLSPAQLTGLAITPAAGDSTDFTLQMTATSQDVDPETGAITTTSTAVPLDVTVGAAVDTAGVSVTAAAGDEDTAIALDITASLPEGSDDTITEVTIAGVPDGATLSAGTDNLDGTWTLTPDQLTNLSITPAANSNADFTLSVTATSQDVDPETGAITTTSTAVDLPVDVTGVADAPTLSAEIGEPTVIVTGGEAVQVTINSSNVTDTGNGFTVAGRSINPNGTLSEPSADLLSFNSNPAGFGVSGGASGADSELGRNASGTSEELIVSFEEQVSSVDVSFAWMNQNEHAGYKLYRDGVEVGEGTVAGGSDGVDPSITLSAGGEAFDEIVFFAPGHDDDFLINSIDFTTFEGGESVAEYPLDIEAGLVDTDGSESLSITVAGLPDGASLSAGTDNGDGTWSLNPDQLDGLTLTAPLGTGIGDFDLTVTATSTEDDGDTASTSATLGVDVPDTEASAPDVTADAASGDEDTAIALDIDAALTDTDGSETLSITIAGVPEDASLSAGTDNGDGSWTLTPEQLDGLTITPPADSNEDFTLSVTATSTEASTGDTSSTTVELPVAVAGVADAPTVAANDVSGDEDTAIALDISAGLTDTDGSETLSVTVAGIPAGATLSLGSDNGNGTWTISSAADLAALNTLTLTPPQDFAGTMNLSVTSTATEDDSGDTETTGPAAFTVTVTDQGDVIVGTPQNDVLIGGAGDDTINALSGHDTVHAGEGDNIVDAGSGNDTVTAGSGDDTVTGGSGHDTIHVGEGDNIVDAGDGNDTVTAGSGDDTVDGGSGNDTIHVGEGDNVVDAGDGQNTVTSGSGDDTVTGGSGNDTLHVGEGDNVVDAGDGQNTVTAGSGDDTVTGGSGNDTLHVGEGDNVVDAGDGHNTVTAGSGDDAVSAGSGNDTIHVGEGDNVVDAGDGHNTVTAGSGDDTVSAGSGNDTIYAGEGDNVVNAGGGHDTVHTGSGDDVITGGAGNDTIYAGEGDNVVNTGTGNDTVYAGSGHDTAVFSGNFEDYTITIFQDGTVTTSGPDGNDTLRGIESLRFDDGEVNVNDIALPPVISVETAQGDEDTAIAVNISLEVANPLASVETITIEGIPTGSTLASGTDALAPEADGSYLLTPSQLEGLTLTPPQDFNGTLSLEVTASTSEGISSEAPAVLPVAVAAVDDAPDVTVAAADGDEDTAIDLDIEAVVPDSTETVESITIAGVPAGAHLSAGTDNGNGSWTLTPGQLSGLTITPPEGDSTDFVLSVTATSTDGGTSDAVALTVTVEDTADIEGTNQADTMVGTEADETMAGHEGDDVVVGGLGDDTIDGGAGDDILIGDNAATGGNSMLHFIDSGNGNIVRMNADGSLEIAVTRDEIEAATGRSDVELSDRGLAIDGAGNIFFTDGKSDAVLMKPADGGAATVLASERDIERATGDDDADPKGITIGADGNLYVVDDESDSVLRIDSVTGAVDQVVSRRDLDDVPGVRDVDLGSGIVAGTDGSIYVTSDDDPKAVFEINPATGEASVLAEGHPFDNPDVFMTVAPNGDLIVADEDADTIFRIPTSGEDKGEVSVFLSENDIQDVIGHDVELKGGIGFDADGNFYIADENTDGIYQWTGYDAATGTIDPDSGSRYLSEYAIETVQSHDTDLEGGIAFSAGGDWAAVNETAGGDDVLIGGAGNDDISGGGGADHLMGGEGDDTLNYSQDATWNSSFVAQNVGDPNSTGTGDQVGIIGEARSYDVFDGGEGEDTIEMTDGDDALFLDDGYSDRPDGTNGPRIVDVENINAGAGNDVVDLTSNQYEYGDVTIDGGEGDDVLWSSSGDDTLEGGAGDDALFGGGGDDLIAGGAGFDTAFYAGNYSEYSIARGTDGSLTISGPEGSDTLTDVEVLDFKDGQVNVDAIGTAPTVQTQTASGREDNSINLGIVVAVANPFAAVTAVTVANIPAGSVVAAGTDEPFELTQQPNGSMSLTLTPDQLSGLNITPPQDFNGVFDLAVTATSSEGVTSAPVAYTVDVEAVNDAPTLSGDGQIDVSGGWATITNQDMRLSDVDNSADELFYQVTDGPDHGDLYLDGNLLGEGDLFTQDDIDTGLLHYVADGGEFEQAWAEGTPSWDEAARSVDQENLTMPQGGESVTLTFQSEGTSEKDIFGWYKIDANGNPGEAHVIWGDTQSHGLDEGETSYTIDGLQPGESFGLFVVPDGKDDHSWINSVPDHHSLEMGSDGRLRELRSNGSVDESTGDVVLATGNGAKSGIDGDGNLKIGFENGSTHHGDFDDLVVTVQYNGQSTDTTNVAENDSFSFTAHDADGQQVEDKTDGDGGYSVSDGQTSVNISIDPTGMS